MRILLMMLLAASAACTAGTAGDGAAAASANANGADDAVASPGKPLHPIQVHAEVDGPLKAGVESAAKIVVRSSRQFEAIEVELLPQLATVVSESRFAKRDGALVHGKPADFAFRFRPASDAPQPVKVLVRATDAAGQVMTREVMLDLGAPPPAAAEGKRRREAAPVETPEPTGDAVVPAQQQIKRGD